MEEIGAATMSSVESHTVLVVDDNPDLLEFLSMNLRHFGPFRVVGAADGIDGLEQAMTLQPACVVIDVKMPGLNGYQLARTLRGDAATAAIPLVILTALTQDKEQFIGLASGADRYLVKPVTPQVLAQVIEEVIAITKTERVQQLNQLIEDKAFD
jgi:DNA-binding response OmpR family regulator